MHADAERFARLPSPPYHAVIFSSRRNDRIERAYGARHATEARA